MFNLFLYKYSFYKPFKRYIAPRDRIIKERKTKEETVLIQKRKKRGTKNMLNEIVSLTVGVEKSTIFVSRTILPHVTGSKQHCTLKSHLILVKFYIVLSQFHIKMYRFSCYFIYEFNLVHAF